MRQIDGSGQTPSQPDADGIETGVLAAEDLRVADMDPGGFNGQAGGDADACRQLGGEQDARAEIGPNAAVAPERRAIMDGQPDAGAQIHAIAEFPAEAYGGKAGPRRRCGDKGVRRRPTHKAQCRQTLAAPAKLQRDAVTMRSADIARERRIDTVRKNAAKYLRRTGWR